MGILVRVVSFILKGDSGLMVVVWLVSLEGSLILLGLVAVFAVVELKNILLDFDILH